MRLNKTQAIPHTPSQYSEMEYGAWLVFLAYIFYPALLEENKSFNPSLLWSDACERKGAEKG